MAATPSTLPTSERRAADAALACAYVAERVQREAPRRWIQGPRRPVLDLVDDASDLVRLFATRDLYRLPRAVSHALVAWARGDRAAFAVSSLPTPRAVLAMQARGLRCVALLDDSAVPAGLIAGLPRRPDAYASGGLAFAIHDLCHLEKFAAETTHAEQVGFFKALDGALDHPAWASMVDGFDAIWDDDRDHVLADMNGSCAFLYVVLRNKVKLAVRRRVARARGVPCASGPLDEREQGEYRDAVEALTVALGLEADAKDAAIVVASRHDAEQSGQPLRAFFASLGGAVIAAPLVPFARQHTSSTG